MKAKIKRLLQDVDLPKYHTKESAAFDIAAAADVTIKAGQLAKIPTGLIIEAPKGHFLLIASRSSLALKKGLMMANGIGVIDPDYSGPEDEIFLIVWNFTGKEVKISKGERLAQGLFLKIEQVNWVEEAGLRDISRGGVGSTGGYY